MKLIQSLKLFVNRRVFNILFLGFSSGVPILLIFSTLGLWLNEAGVVKSTITYFSWAALGYSFKFVRHHWLTNSAVLTHYWVAVALGCLSPNLRLSVQF